MAAPIGNKFWEVRSSHGRNPKFESPEHLWSAAVEYFEWVEENPLSEAKLFKVKDKDGGDEIIQETVSKMRAMTLNGLHLFLGITKQTWANYKEREDFLDVTSTIDNVIHDQKFSGAAADLLNANIIARDLGLKDKTETEHSGSMVIADLTEEQLDTRLKALIDASNGQS